MHAQYGNLAAVNFRLHEEAEGGASPGAEAFLREAVRWLTHAREFSESMDFGGSIDLEVNLAYAYRLQGRLEEVRRASNLARASGSVSDLALVAAERAEIEEASGQRAAAIASLHEALGLLREVGVEEWTRAATHRLDELEGRRLPSGPVKLW